jgi:glycosyltransferase involved in cell wall biosynthesis
MARRNIVFLGYQEDKKLRKLYQQAQALIFPQEEDFGLVALEAQASSTPIIAYRGGGAQETLKEGVTGEFFTPQTETALKAVLLKWSKDDYNNNHYRPWVEQFSQRKFASSWQELINNYVRD